jgi:hypothetical protein
VRTRQITLGNTQVSPQIDIEAMTGANFSSYHRARVNICYDTGHVGRFGVRLGNKRLEMDKVMARLEMDRSMVCLQMDCVMACLEMDKITLQRTSCCLREGRTWKAR